TRAAGAVQREGDGPTLVQRAAQAEQGADGIAAAGAFHRDESEALDDPAHVFAVVAVAAHDPDSHIAKDVGRGNDAGMPEGGDQGTFVQSLLRAFLVGNSDAQGWAEKADKPVSCPDDQAEHDALVQGPAAWARGRFGSCGARGGSAAHATIVTAELALRWRREDALVFQIRIDPALHSEA